MELMLFKFTEYGTLNQIYIAAPNEQTAMKTAAAQGDYRTRQYLGLVQIVAKKALETKAKV